jgi:hypothetical protein
MVSDVVESERVDESNSTLRFHCADGRLIVEVIGEVAEVYWSPKSQKGVLLFRVWITLPNVLEIILWKLTGGEVRRFMAPAYVMQRKLHVGQQYVTNLIDFWRIGEKRETENCDGVAEANTEV